MLIYLILILISITFSLIFSILSNYYIRLRIDKVDSRKRIEKTFRTTKGGSGVFCAGSLREPEQNRHSTQGFAKQNWCCNVRFTTILL